MPLSNCIEIVQIIINVRYKTTVDIELNIYIIPIDDNDQININKVKFDSSLNIWLINATTAPNIIAQTKDNPSLAP